MGKEIKAISPSQIHSHHSCPHTEGTLLIIGRLLDTSIAGHKIGHILVSL